MKKIKLMADYECCPLWGTTVEDFGDINPDTLPISDTLKRELMEWAKWFDGIFNDDDPANSGFESLEDETAFIKQGDNLYERLQIELGSDYEIEWSSRRYGVREK